MVGNEGPAIWSPFPPSTQKEWGLQPVCKSSFQLLPPQTFSSAAACTLFTGCSPFLLQCGDFQAATSFRNLSNLLQCGITHGLWCEYLLHCGLCLSTWSNSSSSFSKHSVRGIDCSTLFSSLLCSVFITSYINSPRDTTNSSAKLSCVLQ